jgi:hypothetical protein
MEKAKGIVTEIVTKTAKSGKDYWFVTIGGVKMLFFDSKITEFLDKEIEVEYDIKTDDKGTTFMGRIPGSSKPSGGAPPKRGTSPEELKQKAIDMKLRTKSFILSYAKDLVVARRKEVGISADGNTPEDIVKEMDVYIKYMLGLVAGNIAELKD